MDKVQRLRRLDRTLEGVQLSREARTPDSEIDDRSCRIKEHSKEWSDIFNSMTQIERARYLRGE